MLRFRLPLQQITSARFSRESKQTVDITNPSFSDGGVTFVGFTDPGKSISSVTITASVAGSGADFIGVDDVTYESGRSASPVPEPSTITLLGSATLGVFSLIRQRFAKAV